MGLLMRARKITRTMNTSLNSAWSPEFTQIAKEIMTSDTQVEFPKLEGKTVYIRAIAMDSLGRVSAPSDTLEYTDRSFLFQILASVLLLGISFR